MSTRNTMTRQHFQLIAEVIREARAFRLHNGEPVGSTAKEKARYAAQLEALHTLAGDFADRLAGTNSGFRREQFLRATDPTEEYKPKRTGRNQHAGLTAYTDTEISDRMTSAYRGETLDLGSED